MPTRMARCNICHKVYEGEGSYKEADRCERQGEPYFKFDVGETVAVWIVRERIVRKHFTTGEHMAYYKVQSVTFLQQRIWSQKKLLKIERDMLENQEEVKRLLQAGVTSFKRGKDTVFKTEEGWYEDKGYLGWFYPHGSPRAEVLKREHNKSTQ